MIAFLSSTCYDLSDLRAEIESFLSSKKYTLLLSDRADFPLSPGTHRHDVCIENVKRCDLFILVIDGRFGGSYYKDSTISITWAEFREAAKNKKKIIAFVRRTVFDERQLYKLNLKQGITITPNYTKDSRVFYFIDEVQTHPDGIWCQPFDNSVQLKEMLNNLYETDSILVVNRSNIKSGINSSKSAIIILELEKIKEEYFNANSSEHYNIIDKLTKYQNHTNYRVAVAVFDFLYAIAGQTRSGMTEDTALAVFSTILNFFPASRDPKNRNKIIKLSDQCINIAYSMVYDALIYLKNYRVAMFGLTIIKYIYKKGKEEKIETLIEKTISIYLEIEETLKRPERNDLQNGLELVLNFKADLEVGSLAFPPLPDHLKALLDKQKK